MRINVFRSSGQWSPTWLRAACWALLPVLLVTPLHAAFQESLWGARPAALSGAFSAIADDSDSPVYNPAGVSWISNSQITFMYAQLYSGISFYSGDDTSRLGLNYLSFAPSIKDKRYGSYAFSWSNFSATNLYREDTFSLTAADSYEFDSVMTRPILSYGANLKILRRAFSTDARSDADPVFRNGRSNTVPAFDFGAMLHPHFTSLPGLKFSFVGQNINQPDIGLYTQDRVPARYVIGAAYQDPRMRSLTPTLDISRRAGRTLVTGGVESWLLNDRFALRAGANADQLSGGMGYEFHLNRNLALRLDYAILWPLNVEGSNGSHRISITTSF